MISPREHMLRAQRAAKLVDNPAMSPGSKDLAVRLATMHYLGALAEMQYWVGIPEDSRSETYE